MATKINKLKLSDIDKKENKNWTFNKVCEKIEELNESQKIINNALDDMYKNGSTMLNYILYRENGEIYVDMKWNNIEQWRNT